MKELTIEEKAQKYDEAIERGKSLLSDNKIGNAWIYKLLPELAESEDEKESEDERIRKQLKAFIHSRASLITQSKHDSWLAWLEKQGEQKPVDPDTLIQQRVDALADIVAEQKPAIEMKSAEESLGIDSDTYNKIVDECIYGEQKPAWSEEDCLQLDTAINIVTNSGHTCTSDWLKSIKDRVQPQTTWKPSEEQMKQLGKVVEQNKDCLIGKELMTLYNDLKKLKEE